MSASRETRLASAQAADAAAEWKRHQGQCPSCSQLRHYYTPCPAGAPLRDAAREAAEAAKNERQMDMAPNPDQEALF